MNRLMSRPLALALPLLVGAMLSGCHRKLAATKPATTATSVAVRPVEPAVQAKNTTFRYLKAKGKLQIDFKGRKQGANMSLRIRRDSAIWLSGSLVGVEGVRALLTPDSVRVVMPLQREYFAGGYRYLSQLLGVPVTFGQLQALLLGDYFPAPAGTAPTVVNEAGRQRVSYPQTTLLLEQLIALSTGRLQQLKVTDSSKPRGLTVDYSDFRPVEPSNLPFAHATFVQARQGADGTTTLSINYSKVDLDRERLNFPFSIPAKYKSVRL
ncbi:DUF4292 domain-containing protein [uncultured Hymenobacter sp.]|uniref:DUF4292 domain-containing protein n=1 Tax=uncultured Hymenobacter sp. TaxID=170016 RepID=UPI0035CAAB43